MTKTYLPHPDDEWVDVTQFGDTEPQYVLGRSGAAAEVAAVRAKYEAGQVPLEQYEAVLERWLAP